MKHRGLVTMQDVSQLRSIIHVSDECFIGKGRFMTVFVLRANPHSHQLKQKFNHSH